MHDKHTSETGNCTYLFMFIHYFILTCLFWIVTIIIIIVFIYVYTAD